MIRPRTGFSAPSLSTIRYLRQLAFPGRYGPDHGAVNCLRRRQKHTFGALVNREYPAASPQASEERIIVPGGAMLVVDGERSNLVDNPNRGHLRGQFKVAAKRRMRTPTPAHVEIQPRLSETESMNWYHNFDVLLRASDYPAALAKLMKSRDNRINENLIQKAAVRLMAIYNRLLMHTENPKIFHFLALFPDCVQTRALNLCLESLIIRKDYTKFIKTFKHYTTLARICEPDHKTYELFIRCMSTVSTVDESRKVMMMLEEQRMPVSPSGFAAYLGGISEKNTSFTLLEREFNWISQRIKITTPAFFNIMIKESLQHGYHVAARRFVEMMLAKDIQPNGLTYGNFLEGQADIGDWAAVIEGIEKVSEKSVKLKSITLNKLLSKYADIQGLDGLDVFFQRLSKEESFPDSASFNIMIRAHLTAVDEPGVMRWVGKMRGSGFEPTATTFNTFFHDLRCSNVPRFTMIRVFSTVFKMDRNKIDAISSDILKKALQPRGFKEETEDEELVVWSTEELNRNRNLVENIDRCIRNGKIRDACNHFREAENWAALTPALIHHHVADLDGTIALGWQRSGHIKLVVGE